MNNSKINSIRNMKTHKENNEIPAVIEWEEATINEVQKEARVIEVFQRMIDLAHATLPPGWIPHAPGDPRPCGATVRIEIATLREVLSGSIYPFQKRADYFWGWEFPPPRSSTLLDPPAIIVGWKRVPRNKQ